MKETREYKVKWEIELDAESPEQAAEMALEMIQADDSSAKVFEIDGVNIDVIEERDKKLWAKIAIEVIGDKPFFGRGIDYLEFKREQWIVTVWKDKTRFDMEVCEDFEQARGVLGEYFFILDNKELM